MPDAIHFPKAWLEWTYIAKQATSEQTAGHALLTTTSIKKSPDDHHDDDDDVVSLCCCYVAGATKDMEDIYLLTRNTWEIRDSAYGMRGLEKNFEIEHEIY
ncbi:hypothetical protein T02_15365 [Trichinella nativa]|uniref:Uncharacterized protein n=1 Tax=Trichinella nativa TaxID=6335 RepID=A0A0V1L5M0_9BILA|nr:hypothetical protein T02_15365 [Trichinella nativa]